MSNISIKINLAALKAVRRSEKGTSGMVDCLIIPVENNYLFKGKNGALYLDVIAFELKNRKEGQNDTHLLKQSLPSEVFKKMTDEEKKDTPILGNATVWTEDRSPGATEKPENNAPEIKPNDNLPF
jgi:hypothetical protein